MSSSPLAAWLPAVAAPAAQWLREHQHAVAIGASAAVLTSSAVGVGLWLRRRASRKRGSSRPTPSIYASPVAEQTIKGLCAESESHFPISFRIVFVDTCLGRSKVTIAGSDLAAPLIIWHGFNTPASFDLKLWSDWSTKFRIILPALPDQPCGCATPDDVGADMLLRWAEDVVRALGVERCAMAGLSHGCNFMFALASARPELFRLAIFINPVNILPRTLFSNIRLFLRFWLPLKAYQVFPIPGNELRLVRTLVEAPSYEFIHDFPHTRLLALSFTHMRRVFPRGFFGPAIHPANLHSFRAKTLVFLSRDDIFSPAGACGPRIRTLFGANLVALEVLPDRHILADPSRSFVQQRVLRFLRDER